MVRPPRRSRAIMGVAGQTATAATGGLVGQLEADREDKGEDELDKGRAVVHQLEVSGFVVKIDGDGAVFSRRFGSPVHIPPDYVVKYVIAAVDYRLKRSRY